MSAERACPTAPGATVGRRRSGRQGAQRDPLALAVELFNASEASRLIGGLRRTLGEPRVSIGAAAGSATEVRVTVAWELSWYQWGIDLRRGPQRVSLISKGGEIAELDGSARVWNGGVAEGGELHLGHAPRRPNRRRRLW